MSAILSAILSDSPRVLHRLGDSSGSTTAQDSSGNNNAGTYVTPGLTWGQTGAYVNDPVTAVLFSGNSGAGVHMSPSLNGSLTGLSAFTVECRFKPTSFSTNPFVVANAASSMLGGFALQVLAAGGVVFQIGNGSTKVSASNLTAGAWTVGQWYYLCATWDGTKARVYVNGTLDSTHTANLSGTLGSTPNAMYIGLHTTNISDYGTYTVQDVALYPIALSQTRITAHYTADTATPPPPVTHSYTYDDLSLYKKQIVKAYQNDGVTYLGVIADAPQLEGFTEAVNAATSSITVPLPRKIDAYDGTNQPGSHNTVVLGNVWKWYLYGPGLPVTGLLRYQGIVDAITPSIDGNGKEVVEVTITPYSTILGDHGIIGPITFGTANTTSSYVDTMAIFKAWFTTQTDPNTGQVYGAPFTLDSTNPATTGNTTFFSFQNQTLLAALTNVLLLSPANWFFRFNMDKTVTFNQFPLSTPTYVLQIGQHFTSFQYSLDNTPRKNLIVLAGAGTVKATAAGASISTIGERVYMKQDSRITDQNTAQLLANGILAFYDRPQIRAKMTIPDYRGDVQFGIGYDIEQFRVGQSVVILAGSAPAASVTIPPSRWGSMVWGRDKWGDSSIQNASTIFGTVVPIVALTYGFQSVTLEIGFRQPSILRSLAFLEAQFNDTTLIS